MPQARRKVVDREVAGSDRRRELAPVQWRGDRGAGPGAGGVSCDCGRTPPVAQVVDVDLPSARALRDGGRVLARGVVRHRLRHALCEGFHGVPIGLRRKRHDHVEALAARRLHETFEPHRPQPLAHLIRGVDQRSPRDVLSRIEIEGYPVRRFDLGEIFEPQGWISNTLAWTRAMRPSRSSI